MQRNAKRESVHDDAFYIAALLELYRATFEEEYPEQAERESYDGAIPSGNSVMAYNLVRLFLLTENPEYDTLIKRQMEFMERQKTE